MRLHCSRLVLSATLVCLLTSATPCLTAAPLAASGLQVLLEVPDVQGESRVPGYQGWIEVDDYFIAAVDGGLAGPQYSFTTTGRLDLSFPAMALKCAKGEMLGMLRLVVLDGQETKRLDAELFNASCEQASFQSAAGDSLTVQFSFTVSDVRWNQIDHQMFTKLGSARGAHATTATADEAKAEGGGKLFLQLRGVKGGSVASGHEEWIEVDSLSWSVVSDGLGGTFFSPLSVSVASFDPSLSGLGKLLNDGKNLEGGTLELVGSSGQIMPVIFEMDFDDSRVQSITSAFAGGVSQNAFQLDFKKVSWKVNVYSQGGAQKGTLKTGFDLETGMPL